MPIRKDLRQFYGPQWRKQTRPRILKRAANCCEQCSAPNSQEVVRSHRAYAGWWFRLIDGMSYDNTGEPRGVIQFRDLPANSRIVRIVLTIAHLNHAI